MNILFLILLTALTTLTAMPSQTFAWANEHHVYIPPSVSIPPSSPVPHPAQPAPPSTQTGSSPEVHAQPSMPNTPTGFMGGGPIPDFGMPGTFRPNYQEYRDIIKKLEKIIAAYQEILSHRSNIKPLPTYQCQQDEKCFKG